MTATDWTTIATAWSTKAATAARQGLRVHVLRVHLTDVALACAPTASRRAASFSEWLGCVGSVDPSTEICDGADNDCNGQTDDNIASCESPVTCPNTDTSRPLSSYALSGGRIYSGTGSNWHWTVECPASVSSCPTPDNATARDAQVYFSQSGAYRILVEVTPDGATEPVSCGWTVYVQGDGLRIELDWDTLRTSGTDVDLHLHRWTQNGTDTEFGTDDDCYYSNCKPGDMDSFYDINWPGHADSPLENCEDTPRGGAARGPSAAAAATLASTST